jgi:PPOX class probable F420-dependent enzyme
MDKQPIPEKYLDIIKKRAFAHVATLMPDGSPQVTPVWIDYDGEYILMNSAKNRQKDRNIQRDPRVALSIQDPDDPYRFIQIRGTVVEITTQGADEHIDKMALKYLGQEKYPNRRPGEVRLIYKIAPQKITQR